MLLKRNFLKRLLSSHKGVSLMAVVMASGMVGGLSLIVLQLTKMQLQSSKRGFQDQTINQILNEINTYFAKEETCTESLTMEEDATTVNYANISSGKSRELTIFSKPGTPRYKKGSKIEQVEITSIVAQQNSATNLGTKSSFDVLVSFERTGKHKAVTPKILKVIGRTNVNGDIENCESYDNTAAVDMRKSICEEDIGGTIDADGKCVYQRTLGTSNCEWTEYDSSCTSNQAKYGTVACPSGKVVTKVQASYALLRIVKKNITWNGSSEQWTVHKKYCSGHYATFINTPRDPSISGAEGSQFTWMKRRYLCCNLSLSNI